MQLKNAFTIAGLVFSLAPLSSNALQLEKLQGPVKQQGPIKMDSREYKSGEILIKLKSGISTSSISSSLSSQGISSIKTLKIPKAMNKKAIARWHVAKIAQGQDEKKLFEKLRKDPSIESVEYNYRRSVSTTIPNDPRFSELWGMNNSGDTGGVYDADIDAPEAWDTIKTADVSVAVIDTGVDYTHEDLAANIWTNPGEIPGNGIDDEGNGFIDDVHGYDFWSNDGDPQDEFGHGTHVAGTIAGVGNNGIGVTGVSWSSKIMGVRFIGPDGYGYDDTAAQSVLYAVANGAKVTNNSWGGGGYSALLYDAISAANDSNVMFAAAAGNYGVDNDSWLFYPASYDLPNIISVAATNMLDQYSWFSNYGKNTVDIAAPGEFILSTVPTTPMYLYDPSGYLYLSGTSMATPHVAGATAILLGQDPTRSVVAIKNLLMDTGDAISDSSGWGRDTVSSSRLNLAKAVNCDANAINLRLKSLADNFRIKQNSPISILASVTACGSPVPDATIVASLSNGQSSFDLYDDGMHDDGAANDGLFGNTWLTEIEGNVTLTLTVQSPSLGVSTKAVSGLVYEKIFYNVTEVPYTWVETSYASRYNMLDDDGYYMWLNFQFEFYGKKYDTILMSSNGLLSFINYAIQYDNQPLPNAAQPNALISPFWDDLKPSEYNIFVQYDGVEPNRSTTFSWVKAGHVDSQTGSVTFQATLYEGSNEIVFQYKDTSFENPLFDHGASATVGVEDEAGGEATLYSHNKASLRNEMALRFTPHFINEAPVANAGGPYESTRIAPITFDGSQSYDPEGMALTYAWDFGDGTTGTGVAPAHQYTALGSYSVSLVVSDGTKSSTTAVTTVSIINIAPSSNAGIDQTVRRTVKSVTLNGSSSSDKDGSIAKYLWKQVSGPIVIFNSPNMVTTTFTMPKNITAPSVLMFDLTVTDSDGATHIDQVTVKVVK